MWEARTTMRHWDKFKDEIMAMTLEQLRSTVESLHDELDQEEYEHKQDVLYLEEALGVPRGGSRKILKAAWTRHACDKRCAGIK